MAQKGACKQAYDDRANAEKAVPVQPEKQRDALISVHDRLHGIHPWLTIR